MKIFLIIGSILAAITIAVVSYILFFADAVSTNNDQFSDLNFAETPGGDLPPAPDETGDDDTEVEAPVLVQVTNSPVLGFEEVTTGSTTIVYYAEAGTGHIFSFDPADNRNVRLSNNTVQNARNAVFSPTGSYVVLAVGEFTTTELVILDLSDTPVSVFRLPARAENISISNDDILLYTSTTNGSTIGQRFDLDSSASLGNLFTLPFSEAVVQWSEDVTGDHVVYPKPQEQLEGAVYTVNQNGNLERLPMSSYGLSAAASDSYVLSSDFEGGENVVFERSSGEVFTSSDYALPEKCAFNEEVANLIACAVNTEFENRGDITAWRQGTLITDDQLNLVDLDSFAETAVDLSIYTNRTFDIDRVDYTDNVLFRNRTDRSLWLVIVDNI